MNRAVFGVDEAIPLGLIPDYPLATSASTLHRMPSCCPEEAVEQARCCSRHSSLRQDIDEALQPLLPVAKGRQKGSGSFLMNLTL
jgi:hypothetical protein